MLTKLTKLSVAGDLFDVNVVEFVFWHLLVFQPIVFNRLFCSFNFCIPKFRSVGLLCSIFAWNLSIFSELFCLELIAIISCTR